MTEYFHSWHAFLQMGHYAAFVWPAYGVVALVLITNLVSAKLQLRQQLKRLKAYVSAA